ncbi:MAG TPA: hypothetical protein VFX97_19165 [Pyrinomonadaceae bacterium]|nr:hypothetical protein [Pyrinomonadaceae bacterium]
MNTRPTSIVLNLVRSFAAFTVLGFFAGIAPAQTKLVTAVRDGSGDLKLISWTEAGVRLNGPGASAGSVSQVSAVRVGLSNRMVTAVRDGGGNLKVIAWRVPFNGQIARLQDGQAGAVSSISAVSVPTGDRIVTAVRDGGGDLKVIVWNVSPAGVVNRMPGEGQAGAVSVISSAFIGTSGTILATAVRDGSGNLKIITWRLGVTGVIARLQEASAGAVSEISAIAQGFNVLVTAVRDGGGNLKLIGWTVAANGAITRTGETQAGDATRISAFHLVDARLATAVRDGGGNLKVITWNRTPTQFTRTGEAVAGAVSAISGCTTSTLVGAPFIANFQTSVRDGSGDLKIIPWRSSTQGLTRLSPGASAGAVSVISTACFR